MPDNGRVSLVTNLDIAIFCYNPLTAVIILSMGGDNSYGTACNMRIINSYLFLEAGVGNISVGRIRGGYSYSERVTIISTGGSTEYSAYGSGWDQGIARGGAAEVVVRAGGTRSTRAFKYARDYSGWGDIVRGFGYVGKLIG